MIHLGFTTCQNAKFDIFQNIVLGDAKGKNIKMLERCILQIYSGWNTITIFERHQKISVYDMHMSGYRPNIFFGETHLKKSFREILYAKNLHWLVLFASFDLCYCTTQLSYATGNSPEFIFEKFQMHFGNSCKLSRAIENNEINVRGHRIE